MSSQILADNQQVRIDPKDNGFYALSMPGVDGVWREFSLSASREAAQESAEFYRGWLKVSGGQDNGNINGK